MVYPYFLSFFLAFLVTYASTPFVKKLALRFHAVDFPGSRKVHEVPVPRWGGLALFLGITAGILSISRLSLRVPILWNHSEIIGIAGACGCMLLLGMADDVWQISAKGKLLVQILAGLWSIAHGIRISFVTNPFTHQLFYLSPFFSDLLTLAWLIGITNALNLLDGLDGLVPGISTISSIALFLVAYKKGYLVSSLVLAGMCGSTLAFLRYNFYPAQIFLGDTGSLFLGMLWANISILGALKTSTVAFFVPLLILGIPIADTLFAIFRRFGKRKPIFNPDKEHFHHRLLALGYTQRQAVFALYAISGLLGTLALLIDHWLK